MKKKYLLPTALMSVLALILGITVAQSATSEPTVQTTTVNGPITEIDSNFCLKDANGGSVIKISDSNEFTFASNAECIQAGGAPGMGVFIQEERTIFQRIFEGVREKLSAALYYITGQKSVSTESTVDSKTTETTVTAPAVKTVVPTRDIYNLSGKSVSGNTGAIMAVKGDIGILGPQALRDIAKDRVRSGVDKKKYEENIYECTAFARDLEKSRPDYYTTTAVICKMKVICTDSNGKTKKYTVWGGHAINDTHGADGKLGYVEPQTGKEVDMDANGDGKVTKDDSSLIAQHPQVQGELGKQLASKAPDCESVEITSTICSVQNYENMADMYKAFPSKLFNHGHPFNPN